MLLTSSKEFILEKKVISKSIAETTKYSIQFRNLITEFKDRILILTSRFAFF